MNTVKLKAAAKLNLALNITGIREDGYHLLEMIMQSVTLFDFVSVTKTKSGMITLESNFPGLPSGPKNIAYQAAVKFYEAVGSTEEGVHIRINKRIPFGSGMAGGSADGAAVLYGMNLLYDTRLSLHQLMKIGEKVGADIPFCLIGGTRYVTGIGENITPLRKLPNCRILIVKPRFSVNTASAFAAYDSAGCHSDFDAHTILSAFEEGDLTKISSNLFNALENATDKKENINKIKQQLLDLGAIGAIMTGSGSAVFGIFRNIETAAAAQKVFDRKWGQVYSVQPCSQSLYLMP